MPATETSAPAAQHVKVTDEDISVAGVVAGKPSGENQESMKKWLLSKSKYLISAVTITVAILHNKNILRFDNIDIALVLISFLPWLPDFVTSLKFGEWEVKFRRLGNKIHKQENRIDRQQEIIVDIVKYSMSESVYTHLWKINHMKESRGEYKYEHNPPFCREMYYLRDAGYIEKEGGGFLDFNEEHQGENLAQIARLTPIGKRIIQLRGYPH